MANPLTDDIPALVAELEASLSEPHFTVEDCWYSCPASGENCRDEDGRCNCGKDARDARTRETIAALSRLSRALAERDAALAEMTRAPLCPLEDYKAQRERADAAEAEDTRKLLLLTAERHQRATVERERDEARAALTSERIASMAREQALRAALARYEADDRRIRRGTP